MDMAMYTGVWYRYDMGWCKGSVIDTSFPDA